MRKFTEESDSLRFLKRFVECREELLELSEDVQELRGFYTNQKHSWEQLRTAVEELAQNRLQLEADQTAGPALARMEEILAAPRPYGMLHEAASLTHTARSVNDRMISDARNQADAEIQGLIDGVKAELDKAAANAALRQSATDELARLLAAATQATSIAHIAQARQAADAAFDRALTAIESHSQPKPDDPTAPQPPVKKRRVVEAKSFCVAGFIETREDAESFLSKLRAELEAALEADERVQIK